jgi:methyl-accepting chemotaxis protein
MTRTPPPITPELLEALARQVRSGRLQLPTAGRPPASPAVTPSAWASAPAATPPAWGGSAPTPSAPQPASAGGDQRGAAMLELTRARATVSDIIVDANRVTEVETLAVGESLQAIVRDAERFVAELHSNFSALQSTNDNGGLVHLIEAQREAIVSYVTKVNSEAAENRSAAKAALEQTQTIMRVGTNINEVARSSKMLALNASIEAARLGQAGRSFAVIAAQMQTLSDKVHESNQLITQLANGLLELLPHIVQISEQLAERSEGFTRQNQAQSRQVQEGTARLEAALNTSMKGGDLRLAAILKHSQEALSHLQFQDPTAQRLMRIDRTLETVQRRIAEALEQDAAAALIEDPLQVELGGGVDTMEAPESGEVMLF